jgi:predicted secreted Zn-dependent protease
MKTAAHHWLRACAVLIAVAPTAAHAEGQVFEQVKTYAISGTSALELYASIGERGPKASVGRAIAHTNFKLTWQRKYEPQGDACMLVSAKPKLIITYTLPKPAGRLPAALQQRWDIFYEGVRRHELVHGQMIKDMVATIERTTIGLSAPGDPGCKKIRQQIIQPLSEASLAQRQQSSDFDRVELNDGGNVHRLILAFVNGQ